LLNIILIAMTMQGGSAKVVAEFFHYLPGERWVFTVTSEALDRTPSWLEDELSPPLPPRRAGHVAMQQLGTLVADAERWRLNTISLQPTGSPGKWVYIVKIEEPPPRSDGGVHGSMSLVVLMDGRAVVPRREPWPQR
jgi:hypothetical protein